jgi:hypothetical protein
VLRFWLEATIHSCRDFARSSDKPADSFAELHSSGWSSAEGAAKVCCPEDTVWNFKVGVIEPD